ncbi:MAG: phosphoenolpyruvate synthase [Leptolyngbya sp.]|nr:MAG: phosphoenolpyruvate synthase [Leptolyngbya sp.]
MNTLYRLDQIELDQIALVGQKAFYLGQLLQKGHPVVPGVVIPRTVFQTFLAQVDWSDPLFADIPNSSLRLNIEDWQQLQAIAQHLRRAILATPLPSELQQALVEITQHWHPATVIVRPSLGFASSKRSLHTKTNLEALLRTSVLMTSQVCILEDAALESAIQHLWADFFGAKSLFYWQRLGIPLHQVQLSTLIQPIPTAIAAGTLRLVNDHMEIQATPGLGMAIARGEVIPDTYQVQALEEIITAKKLGFRTIAYTAIAPTFNSQPLQIQILDAAQQESFALEEEQIIHLATLGQQVLTEIGAPVELEWVLHHHNGMPTLEFTQVIPLKSTSLPSNAQFPPIKVMPDRKSTQALMPEGLSEAVLVASGTAASPGHAIAPAWILHIEDDLPLELPIGSVLVTKTLPLEWLPLLKHAAAIVMEQGSPTSHSAIVARELGIPAVVGALHATDVIQRGDFLWVDGDRGQVYRVPQSFKIHSASLTDQAASQNTVHHPETIRSAIATQLMVNLSHLEHLATLKTLPIDGIGLIRAELLAPSILGTEHPTTWLQHHTSAELITGFTTSLLPLAQAVSPRPVFYRSLDLRPQEFRPLGSVSAISPTEWGLRGTRSYQANPALFDLELAALAQMQQAGATNLCLILPFVRTVEEFEFCRERVEKAGLTQYPAFQLWIMAEVPSVLFLLADYVKAGVQGISLGTNDLTQLLFDLDRNQPQTWAEIDERHPAVKRAIAQLIRQAQENNIPCSICGEAPVRYPELIPDLIRWGITSISVAPEAVETTYGAIAQAEQTLRLEASRLSLP